MRGMGILQWDILGRKQKKCFTEQETIISVKEICNRFGFDMLFKCTSIQWLEIFSSMQVLSTDAEILLEYTGNLPMSKLCHLAHFVYEFIP